MKNCPKCNSSWEGESIYQTFIEQRNAGSKIWQGKSDDEIKKYVGEFYGKENARWSREVAIEYQGIYDGALVIHCPDCECYIQRFTGEIFDTQGQLQEYIEKVQKTKNFRL